MESRPRLVVAGPWLTVLVFVRCLRVLVGRKLRMAVFVQLGCIPVRMVNVVCFMRGVVLMFVRMRMLMGVRVGMTMHDIAVRMRVVMNMLVRVSVFVRMRLDGLVDGGHQRLPCEICAWTTQAGGL